MNKDSEIRNQLEWLESSGGPFVVLSTSNLTAWKGAEGLHYGIACEVDDYLGAVLVDDELCALVVGDEPLPSTFIPELGCILQWQYAPSEQAIVSAAIRLDESTLDWHIGPSFDFPESAVMIDAAASGDSLESGEMLAIPVSPGRYECSTADFSVDDDLAGRLHRFRRVER